MASPKLIGKKLSAKMHLTTSELYSGDSNARLSSDAVDTVKQEIESIKKYDIYYVDYAGTVDSIKSTIEHFQQNEAKGRWLIVILDHTLLIRGQGIENERTTLANLQRVFIEARKQAKTTIFQLSQLNREIESVDRINNHAMHFPMRKDISSSDSVYQASDVVIVIHRPELLNITAYGSKGLPTKDMVYLHIIKAREGEQRVLKFWNNLKHNSIEEEPPVDTTQLTSLF